MNKTPPILSNKEHKASSVFSPEKLLREARRQRSIPIGKIPEICILDPDGDIVRNLLEQSHIHWWFKNGDRDAVFLAVPYQENSDKKPFYVDFIVQMKDGSVGLFDTKSGLTRQVAGSKIDGLNAYIKEQNKKGKNLFGGIVTNTDARKFTGRWIYFNKDGKALTTSNDNWENLAL